MRMQGVGAGDWGWGVYVYIRILCIRCMNIISLTLFFNVVLYMYCCAYMDSVIEMQRRKSGLYTRGQRRIIKMQIEIPNDDSREGPVC